MKQTDKGFTFIELALVVAIISIMTLVTITSLSGAREDKQVEGEARKFAASVRELQNYALTGKKINTANPPSCRFGVSGILSGDPSYIRAYRYRHPNGSSCNDVAPTAPVFQNMGVVNLEAGVAFAIDVDGFGFSVPRGELVSATGPINTTVVVQLSKGSSVWSVCIYPGGRIQEQKGSACP